MMKGTRALKGRYNRSTEGASDATKYLKSLYPQRIQDQNRDPLIASVIGEDFLAYMATIIGSGYEMNRRFHGFMCELCNTGLKKNNRSSARR